MAKISLSPLIVDIRNKQSDTVFSKWKGINYIRSRVTPSNPKTTRQTEVRNAMATLVALWQSINPYTAANLTKWCSGKDLSSFNRFIQNNVKAMRAGTRLKFNEENGYWQVPSISAATGSGSGEINLATSPSNCGATQVFCAFGYEPTFRTWTSYTTFNSSSGNPKVLAGFTPGGTAQIYCFLAEFTPVNGMKVSVEAYATATAHA